MKPIVTTGVFHRRGTTRLFDAIQIANGEERFLNFYDPFSTHIVRGFDYDGNEHTGAPGYAENDIDALIFGGYTDGFDPMIRQMIGGHKAGPSESCGEGRFGGNRSAVYDVFGCDNDTPLHERAHNGRGDGTPVRLGTGLGHSHRMRGDVVGNMNDDSSLLSSGAAQGLLSAHICAVGWNRPEETVVVTKNQQVLIAPVEMAGLHSGDYAEFKHVIIRVPRHNDFFLSTRLDHPYKRGNGRDETLYVHELWPNGHPEINDDPPNTTLRYDDLLPGDSHMLPNGVRVRYVAWDDGIARVDIIFDPDLPIVEVLQSYALPEFGEPPVSGWYYNPVSSGQGILVHKHGNISSIYWYTNNNDSDGYPRFYFASGISNLEMILYTTAGGTPTDPASSDEVVVGVCRFTGDKFVYRLFSPLKEGDDPNERVGLRGGVEVIPLIISESDGVFYYRPRSGEGISVHYFTDEKGVKRCAVGFWSYGPKKFATLNTTQRWYTSNGTWNNGQYDLEIDQSYGRFQCANSKVTPAGTGRLIPGDNEVSFQFTIGNRSETYVMERLIGS